MNLGNLSYHGGWVAIWTYWNIFGIGVQLSILCSVEVNELSVVKADFRPQRKTFIGVISSLLVILYVSLERAVLISYTTAFMSNNFCVELLE
jgi:hypothetical protein